MKVRKADLKDTENIAKVLISSYNIDSIKEGKNVFIEETKKDHYYIVAEENEEILGIASWRVHGLPKHQLAELHRIAVLPEYRGKGISQQLFEALINEAKEFYNSKDSRLRKIHLYTHASNKRAQGFYKKIGFIHEATLKDHYYNGEDEMVFSLFLNEDEKNKSNNF